MGEGGDVCRAPRGVPIGSLWNFRCKKMLPLSAAFAALFFGLRLQHDLRIGSSCHLIGQFYQHSIQAA